LVAIAAIVVIIAAGATAYRAIRAGAVAPIDNDDGNDKVEVIQSTPESQVSPVPNSSKSNVRQAPPSSIVRQQHQNFQGDLKVLIRQLNLTQEQQQQVTDVIDTFRSSLQSIQQQLRTATPEQRQELLELRNQRRNSMRRQISNLLTPVQRKILSELEKKRQQSHPPAPSPESERPRD